MAVACFRDFELHPLFTQRKFSSETGNILLNTAVAAAEAVGHSSEFDSWKGIGVEVDPVVVDLLSCRQKVLLRRKTVKEHGSVSLVQTLLQQQQLASLHPARLSAFLLLLRWEMFNISTNIINLVSLVVVDLG